MSNEAFPDVPKIAYEGPDSKNPLAFKQYQKDEVIAGTKVFDFGQSARDVQQLPGLRHFASIRCYRCENPFTSMRERLQIFYNI